MLGCGSLAVPHQERRSAEANTTQHHTVARDGVAIEAVVPVHFRAQSPVLGRHKAHLSVRRQPAAYAADGGTGLASKTALSRSLTTLSWLFLPASLISLILVSASRLASSSACLLPWVCCCPSEHGGTRVTLMRAGEPLPRTSCTPAPCPPCTSLSPSWPRLGPP